MFRYSEKLMYNTNDKLFPKMFLLQHKMQYGRQTFTNAIIIESKQNKSTSLD
jgi:hypothetical protein